MGVIVSDNRLIRSAQLTLQTDPNAWVDLEPCSPVGSDIDRGFDPRHPGMPARDPPADQQTARFFGISCFGGGADRP